MTDQPQKRRNWRRWVVGAVVVLVIGCGWMHWQSVSLMNRAKLLRLGMTEAEMLEIMGPSDDKFSEERATSLQTSSWQQEVTSSYSQHEWKGALEGIREGFDLLLWKLTGASVPWMHTTRPVEVRLRSGTVYWIRRGDEIIE